ncbi:MAG: CoA ester lyase [Gemmatimonadota bacterium]|nr:CoA ester lyase [Gemmatimonadota bacterium]
MSGTGCLLFFPGTRPELLPKAIASGASRVCVDLEDAVAAGAKSEARASVIRLFEEQPAFPGLGVRINHPSTSEGALDLEAIGGLGRLPDPLTIMLPKTDSPEQVNDVRECLTRPLGEVWLIPVVETLRGLSQVEHIAAARGVSALLFGGLDLSVALGCALEWEALLYARSRCVHSARLAGVEMIDTPFFDVEDPDGLRRESARARRLGFTGKAAIHPSQVAVIEEAFAPTDEDVDRARRVIAASERERRGAFLLDGVMIDRPTVEAARRLVDRCGTKEE